MPSWPSGKMSAVVPSCCPWSRATTGCPCSSLTLNRGGSGGAWASPAAGAAASSTRTGIAPAVQQRPARKGEEGRPARFSHRRPRGLLCALPGVSDSEATRKPGPIVPGPCPVRLAATRRGDGLRQNGKRMSRHPALLRCPGAEPRSGCRLIAQGSGDTRDPGRASGPLRHRGQTRRRAISGWRIRMAVPQPPQAMTTGSMASLVSRVCLKEFVEGVLFSFSNHQFSD